MTDKNDYLTRLERARRKRNGNDNRKYLIGIAAGLVILIVIVAAVFLLTRKKEAPQPPSPSIPIVITATGSDSEKASASDALAEARRIEAEKQQAVESFNHLGLVTVEGYLNVRKEPDQEKDNVIGIMQNGSACEILGEENGWYHIQSGLVEGYILGKHVITGEEAKAEAVNYVKKMAIVKEVDSLRIRSTPDREDSTNIVGQALTNERYPVLGQENGWVQIKEGYMAADYVEIRYAMDEARKMDLKAMAVDKYDNIIISNPSSGYVNVRSSPENQGDKNVIGKFPKKAAGEVLESLDGWYKIQSGGVTGYVSAEHTITGDAAREIALETASRMAIVKVDRLNVRNTPSLENDNNIWTKIAKEERYHVLNQLDGWVQIELDSGEENADEAYISTRENNVEVRYALNEAIKFSPLEEKANAQASRRSKIVNYALQFIGNPYVWGGTSLTKGADCSGFTMSVMGHFGISLPHYSGAQSKLGRKVTSSDMRPGDLIFYANSSGTINHVAIYIGNGQIVHAASKRSGIKVSRWNYRTPKAIRNVID